MIAFQCRHNGGGATSGDATAAGEFRVDVAPAWLSRKYSKACLCKKERYKMLEPGGRYGESSVGG